MYSFTHIYSKSELSVKKLHFGYMNNKNMKNQHVWDLLLIVAIKSGSLSFTSFSYLYVFTLIEANF